MSSGRLQTSEVVDALVLASRNEALARSFRVSELSRLAEFSANSESIARLQARFHLVDGRCGVAGQVTATLRAVCQRCLQPLNVIVDDQFHLVVVRSEKEMNELPEAQDSVIANAEQLDLQWLAEEQLLLAVPLVPLHSATEECGAVSREEIPQVSEKRNAVGEAQCSL